jgi:protein TonB
MTNRLIGAALSLSLLVAAPAAAQTSVSREQQLLQQTSQFPREVAPYLELARLYFDQGRFDDAERVLTQAIGTVQRVRATSLSATRPAPITNRVLLSGTQSNQPNVTTVYPADAVRVGGDIREPKKISDMKPVYPAEAIAAGVQGIVILEIIIDRDGSVSSALVLRPVQMLDQAALDAVKQWRFTPTLLNGAPVPVIMTVTVNFTLG